MFRLPESHLLMCFLSVFLSLSISLTARAQAAQTLPWGMDTGGWWWGGDAWFQCGRKARVLQVRTGWNGEGNARQRSDSRV